MSKILTDELIKEKLAKQGWLDINEVDHKDQKKMVLDHYNVEFTDQFSNNCDYYIYSESTADGYEVWIATGDMRNVCVSEDVYYYDSDLNEVLADAVKDKLSTIYVDDEDAYFVCEAITELYDYMYNRKCEEIEKNLKDEGYNWEQKD